MNVLISKQKYLDDQSDLDKQRNVRSVEAGKIIRQANDK